MATTRESHSTVKVNLFEKFLSLFFFFFLSPLVVYAFHLSRKSDENNSFSPGLK